MIHIRGHINYWTGFGRLACEVGLGLARSGWPVRFNPRAIDERNQPLPPGVRPALGAPGPSDPVLCVDGLGFVGRPVAGPLAAFTMWEVAGVPPRHVAALNRCKLVLTPSRFCASVFSAAGVTAPVRVVPLGIDPADYAEPDPGPPPGPVTFGCMGWVSSSHFRKGIDDVVEAFRAAFPGRDDVRLRVKVWPGCVVKDFGGDDRVEVDRSPLGRAELTRWFRSLDCFVSASRGEGWGLCVHEALAAGRPVIATDWGGQAELVSRWSGLVLPYRLEPSGDESYHKVGVWARPDFDALVEAMKTVAADPLATAEAAAPGMEAARSLTWDRCVLGVEAALEESGLAKRPEVLAPPPRGRVLVRRNGAIGDVLACEPALRAIRAMCPGHDLVLQTGCVEASQGCPHAAEVRRSSPADRVDLVIDLNGAYEHHLDRPRQETICKAAGVPYPGPSRYWLTLEGEVARDEFRAGPRPLVVFCPHAHWSCRRWDAGRWRDLADACRAAGWRVVEVSEPQHSTGAGEPFHGPWARAAGVIAAADCWVGVDSGPMWAALGLGVPTVALFGPTTPGLVSDHQNLIPVVSGHQEDGCHHRPPFPKDRCVCPNSGAHPGMLGIQVDEVFRRIEDVMRSKSVG